jgi:hypothetical protein
LKSPEELAGVLVQLWHRGDKRERQLLEGDAWPLELAIGRPSPRTFAHDTAKVREHIARWRAVSIGTVEWEVTTFRSGAKPVSVPARWLLSSPEEASQGSADEQVWIEFTRLRRILKHVPPEFHPTLVRQRRLWRDRNDDDVVRAAALATALEPQFAEGRPLRSVALAGIDTKFMERNRGLVTALLDVRFDGQASALGLQGFLGAADEGDHWLLVAPLSPGLLPFAQQRVRARELAKVPLPGVRILLVENDRSFHQLPPMANTVAVLGAGADLAWVAAPWLKERSIGYWGDMDTWGLQLLARARRLQPHVTALLMDQSVFDRHEEALAVPEKVPAGPLPPDGLTAAERTFYLRLLGLPKGRIEQEFLPTPEVIRAISEWTD